MHRWRRSRVAACATGAVLALVAAAPAAADEFEPLNPYLVSGKGASADELARKGYDLREGHGRRGKFGIVATAKQADKLRGEGMTVEAPVGEATRAMEAPQAANPLVPPTHGYDVYRPWSLAPAPCPTRCTTPLKPLKDIYADLAAANGDVVTGRTYGRSLLGQELVSYRVTSPRGGNRKPVVLFNATQHAREWIAAETNRRLFQYVLEHKDDDASGIPDLLRRVELWFVPIVNPDGYDYTFVSKATRLWRKNLRDVDSDGEITNLDGVDPNRNWPEKWNFDLEGASADSTSETYHGAGPASEPEVAAFNALIRQIRPRFQIDYHSFGELILYPEGWQVETPATDAPLMEALAGTDRNPAIERFDPDVSAELYTTNGDITDHTYKTYGTQAYTVELDAGSGPAVGGTQGDDNSFAPDGFVFQDSEADVQAVFENNLAFALDLAKSAPDPDEPVSHLGNEAPNFVPTTFATSFGDPQTVEVNAKRALGRVRVHWQVNGGREQRADTREFGGGERYGEPGVYYHRLRGTIRGTSPGDTVRVWFEAGGERSASFEYRAASESDARVLLLGAEDVTGASAAGPTPRVSYQDTFRTALADAGVPFDVYDVDAQGRLAPSHLGVLSHYDAVVWFTGDDLYVRNPGQPGGTGVDKLLDDEILAVRDFLNEGGKTLVNGKFALQGAWDGFLFNPLDPPGPGLPDPLCATNQTQGQNDADDPPGQEENCVAVSNDFQQYWLGAYLPIAAAASVEDAAALPFLGAGPPFGTQAFTVNGPDSAQNQDNVYSLLTTSSILPPATYPQFTSRQAIKFDRPPSFDPPSPPNYVYSGQEDSAYKRLTRTVDLTGSTSGSLRFKTSYDTEPGFDFLVVEARTVGQEDWTTLPDTNGHTTEDTGAGCPDDDPFWLNENPFLTTYITRTVAADGTVTCAPARPGSWNAASGNSAGFQDWNVDLSAFAGRQVEVSIAYVSDPAVQGLGVFIDDTVISKNGADVPAESTSFDDGPLGGWAPTPAPAGSGDVVRPFAVTPSVGFVDGPGVATDDTVYWGFGLEGVTGREARAQLLGDALRALGVQTASAAALRAAGARPARTGVVRLAATARGRTATARVRCAGRAGACAGTLQAIDARGATVGSARFRVRPGASRSVRVRLAHATRRITLVARGRDTGGRAFVAKARSR
jgi:murein tripeptide amidase MpaA